MIRELPLFVFTQLVNWERTRKAGSKREQRERNLNGITTNEQTRDLFIDRQTRQAAWGLLEHAH